jgi:hypothetical protein
MSASDDLSASLSTLSFLSSSPPASRPSTPSAESSFVLVSSDGHHISVDPSILASASSVFCDVLGAGSGEPVCEVNETEEEVGVFVEALRDNREHADAKEWVALWQMMDKYDAPSLRVPLILGAR